MKLPPKIEKAMGSIAVGRKKPIEIREVVGPDGQKVGEYLNDDYEKLPYHVLQERHQV